MASGNRTDISLDDPNFWQKWAKIAELDTEANNEKVQHILFLDTSLGLHGTVLQWLRPVLTHKS